MTQLIDTLTLFRTRWAESPKQGLP